MADNEEISPAVSDEANTPDKKVNSTPSTGWSKGSQLPALRRQSQESSSSSSSSSESGSSSSEDSDSSKLDSRHKKRQVRAERDTSNNTPPKHEGDEYECFDNDEISLNLVRYLAGIFRPLTCSVVIYRDGFGRYPK